MTQEASCCTLIAENFALTSPEILAGQGFSRLLVDTNINSCHLLLPYFTDLFIYSQDFTIVLPEDPHLLVFLFFFWVGRITRRITFLLSQYPPFWLFNPHQFGQFCKLLSELKKIMFYFIQGHKSFAQKSREKNEVLVGLSRYWTIQEVTYGDLTALAEHPMKVSTVLTDFPRILTDSAGTYNFILPSPSKEISFIT